MGVDVNTLSKAKVRTIISLLRKGAGIREVVRVMGVAKNTVRRINNLDDRQLPIERAVIKITNPNKYLNKIRPDAKHDPGDGFCRCGCGGRTKICHYDDPVYGYRAGDYRRYIQGHYSRMVSEGKRDRHGLTQYERHKRNDKIFHFLRDLLPYRRMTIQDVGDMVRRHWPTLRNQDVSRICTTASVRDFLIVAERKREIKRCGWCGQRLEDNRKTCCSEGCYKARTEHRRKGRQLMLSRNKIPVHDSSVLLSRDLLGTQIDWVSELALEVAESISKTKSHLYIGPAWVGIRESWDSGQRDHEALREAAVLAIKANWKSESDYGVKSLGSMKEDFDYEPVANGLA